MRTWIVSGVAVLGALALALAMQRAEPASESHARARPSFAPRFAFGSPSTTSSFVPPSVYGFADGGVFAGIDTGPPPEPEPATGMLARAIEARLCPAAARTLCAGRDALGCPEPETWTDENGDERDWVCDEAARTQCQQWVERRYGYEADSLVISESALRSCIDALREDLSGGETVNLDPTCYELASEPGRYGEPCVSQWLRCGDDGQCIDGRCEPPVGVGDPCDERVCTDDLVCVVGLCDAGVARGGACDDESVCARRGDSCLDGVCAPHRRDGSSCQWDTECAVGSRCNREQRCVRASPHDCTLDTDCGRGRACLGTYVSRCEIYPSAGERCESSMDCEPYLQCEHGVCALGVWADPGPAALGALCEPGIGCAVGLVCAWNDGDAYRCVRGRALGETCAPEACTTDLLCIARVEDGVCAPAVCAVRQFFSSGDEE